MSPSGEPSSKRARTEAQDEIIHNADSNVSLERNEIWFEDGNIILVAENVAFRVYQGVLSQYSPIFHDMFTIPQPDAREAMDGCPLVHLSDSASDLAHLLRLIFGNVKLYQPESPAEFAVVSAVIRLGHKYDLKDIYQEALNMLESVYTTRPPDGCTIEDYLWQSPLPMMLHDAITVVVLCHLIGNQSILPMAYYACCQLDGPLVDGVSRGQRKDQLSSNDLKICIAAKAKLAAAGAAAFLQIYDYDAQMRSKCLVDGACREHYRSNVKVMAMIGSRRVATLDPLGSWGDRSMNLCSVCRDTFNKRAKEQQAALWKKLPRFFGIQMEWPISQS